MGAFSQYTEEAGDEVEKTGNKVDKTSTKQQLNAAAAKQNAAAQMQNAGAQKVAGAATLTAGKQAAAATINWKKLLVVSKFLPHLMFVALAVGTVTYAIRKLIDAQEERRKKEFEALRSTEKHYADMASRIQAHRTKMFRLTSDDDLAIQKLESDQKLYDRRKKAEEDFQKEIIEARKKAGYKEHDVEAFDELRTEAEKLQKELADPNAFDRYWWQQSVEDALDESDKQMAPFLQAMDKYRLEMYQAQEEWEKTTFKAPQARFEGIEQMGRRIQEATASGMSEADKDREIQRRLCDAMEDNTRATREATGIDVGGMPVLPKPSALE
jgi:hypothetical protein